MAYYSVQVFAAIVVKANGYTHNTSVDYVRIYFVIQVGLWIILKFFEEWGREKRQPMLHQISPWNS